MGLFGKSKNEKFVEAHPAPEGKAPLLCYGAMLIKANGEVTEALAMENKAKAAQLLEDFWSASNEGDAKETVRWLMSQGNRAEWDRPLTAYVEGDTDALDEDTRARLEGTAKIFDGNVVHGGKYTEADVKSVTTILSWDLERAAFVARCAFNAGYMSEDEVWKLLELVDKAAKPYATWNDYMLGYLVGRALVMTSASPEDNRQLLWDVRMLEWEKKGIWRRNPRS